MVPWTPEQLAEDDFLSNECWCGFNHAYLDYDADGNPFDSRDVES